MSRLHKPETTIEERTEKARQYLREHPMMRVADYALLTGLTRIFEKYMVIHDNSREKYLCLRRNANLRE